MAASFRSISRSRTVIAPVKKGTTTSPFTIFSEPLPVITINSYSNIAKELNPDDTSSRTLTQFFNLVKDRCKSQNLKLDDALDWFDRMLLMKPLTPIDVFSHILGAVAKIKHHSTVVSLYFKMVSIGIAPNIFSMSILLNCYCRFKTRQKPSHVA